MRLFIDCNAVIIGGASDGRTTSAPVPRGLRKGIVRAGSPKLYEGAEIFSSFFSILANLKITADEHLTHGGKLQIAAGCF